MSGIITQIQRGKYRAVIRTCSSYVRLLENHFMKNIPVHPRVIDALTGTCQSNDPEVQLRAMRIMLHDLNQQYDEELRYAGGFRLSPFCEYMYRDEPPAKHHEFLIDHMELVHHKEIMRLQISLPPGSAKALVLDTRVTTQRGTILLGKIKVGDRVLTQHGRFRKVTAIHKGNFAVHRLVMSNGRQISGDPTHRFLTEDGWVELCNIKVGDHLMQPSGWDGWLRNTGPGRESVELAAVYCGIGFSDINGFYFRPRTPQESDYICKRLSEMFPDMANCAPDKYGKVRASPMVTTNLNNHGMSPFKKDKRLPAFLISAPHPVSALFMSIFSRFMRVPDHYPHVEWNCGNEQMAKDVHDLAARLGIPLKICETHRGNFTKLYIPGPHYKGLVSPLIADFDLEPVRVVESSATLETAPMRCLTVNEDESFIAEGFVTHNSSYASIRFPAWHLGRKPDDRFMMGAHTQGFAKDRLGKPVRSLINEDRYRKVFPDMSLSASSAAADYFEFTAGRGYFKAIGVGVGISGYRADIAGIDDPIASREDAESPTNRRKLHEWYEDDFSTRPMPGSPVYLTATRWHEDDLSGYLLHKVLEGKSLPWHVINIPALAGENDPLGRAPGEGLWPEVFGTEFYLDVKRSSPGRKWNSLYQGNPVDEEGGVLKRSDVSRYKTAPMDEKRGDRILRKIIKRRVLSVDCAEKATQRADYTAATIWVETTEKKHYLIHAARCKKEFTDMVSWIEELAAAFDVDSILVEDRGAGTQYIQVRTKHPGPVPVIAISTKQQSKEFRFDGVTPMFASGQALFPMDGNEWIADVESELFGFPNGRNDDYVDSVSQYLARARDRTSRRGVSKIKSSQLHS